MNTSPSVKEIIPALLKVQEAVGTVKKNSKNPHFGNNYANITDLIKAVKPVLTENKLYLSQCGDFIEGSPILITRLTHESGEFAESTVPVLCAKKDDPQKYGSGLTYARRYSLESLLALPTEDDDGNAAAGNNSNKNNNTGGW